MTMDAVAKYALVVLGYAALGFMVYLGKFDAGVFTNMVVAGLAGLTGYHVNGGKVGN